MANEITASEKTPLWGIEPTEVHSIIANDLISQKAYCLSLNFDGLTIKAVKQEEKNPAIITIDEECSNYFTAHDIKLIPVFKLRGDIFYAVCRTDGCPLYGKETPVYTLLHQKDNTTTKNIDNLTESKEKLKCFSCAEQRLLFISFPGVERKETEIVEFLRTLWRFLGFSIQKIIIIGFSGNWDSGLLYFLERVLEQNFSLQIDIVDKNKTHAYIYLSRHNINRIKLIEVKEDASEYFKKRG